MDVAFVKAEELVLELVVDADVKELGVLVEEEEEEEDEEVDEEISLPTVAASFMTSFVSQHAVVVPQHQSVEFGVPSQGVMRVLEDESSVNEFVHTLMQLSGGHVGSLQSSLQYVAGPGPAGWHNPFGRHVSAVPGVVTFVRQHIDVEPAMILHGTISGREVRLLPLRS